MTLTELRDHPITGDRILGVSSPPGNELDPSSNEYYLHLSAKEQPGGVDGLRIDMVNFISKNPAFPVAPITDPPQPWQDDSMHYACGPKLHDYHELGCILKEYSTFSVGEIPLRLRPDRAFQSGRLRYGRFEHGLPFRKRLERPLPQKPQPTPKPFTPPPTNPNKTPLTDTHSNLASQMLTTISALQSGLPFIRQGQ
ncbi:hypothetical protein EMCG_03525 [[Emmonsia] crescens]|uniref:Uncharacterized protein n=1 Tax=[Emmonsia] crescens TaxID=73230 RepID=A0A0G2HV88_9EURO|nr:hypothetical protein EMCG_03525 [Emmonsia crescens UAMH 3008]